MSRENSQVTLLRIAAFVIDALALSLILILPGSVVSYAAAWFGSIKLVSIVWYIVLLIFMTGMLLRDGLIGRSPGKTILGLQLAKKNGGRCGYGCSLLRNLPLMIPLWNLVEIYLVLFGSRGLRTGDRLAGTAVVEE